MNSESLITKCKSCGKDILKSARSCPQCGKTQKKISITHWVGIVFIGLIMIGIIRSPENTSRQTQSVTSQAKVETSNSESIKDKIKSNIKLDFTWKKEGFGAIMEADFIIQNNSTYDIKDIEILCMHYAKSGTKIDSNSRTIYEIIRAKSSKSYTNFNMGFIHDQANASSCIVNDFSLAKY